MKHTLDSNKKMETMAMDLRKMGKIEKKSTRLQGLVDLLAIGTEAGHPGIFANRSCFWLESAKSSSRNWKVKLGS